MADHGLFVGFGWPVRGREQNAAKVFNEAIGLWTKLQDEGAIESWEAIFLEPHGGDLGGFFVVRGERDRIAQIRVSDEMERLTTRAQLIVENLGVVGLQTGGAIAAQMQLFLESAGELA